MMTCRVVLLFLALAAIGRADDRPTQSAAAPIGCGLESGLSALHEMDMHLHCGKERPVPMDQWIDLAVSDGRKVLVALDHRELYDRTAEEQTAWAKEKGFKEWYSAGRAGMTAFMDDVAQLRNREDVIVFSGWEIGEFELDEGLDREAMRLPEVIGWHMSPNTEVPPCGKTLIHRIEQITAAQEEFPVPMIVFHPFSMRIERIQRDAQKQGKTVGDLSVDDYRFFQPGEQEDVARLLAGKSIYIEISHGITKYWDDPVVREAVIADIRPLVEAGVQFTVSTDNHGLAHASKHFEPEVYCGPLGITPENANTLVRELLAIRAKRSVEKGLSAPVTR